MFEYYMCTGCGKEFFSEKDFKNHACFTGRSADPNGRISKLSSPTKVGANTNDSQATIQTQNADGDGTPPVSALDLRMDAKKELIEMKKVLVANGISAQTLNEEQTKAEYDKLQKKLATKEEDSIPLFTQPETTATATAPTSKKTRKKNTQEG